MEHMLPSFMKIASRRIDNQIVYDPEVTMGLYFGEDNVSQVSAQKPSKTF